MKQKPVLFPAAYCSSYRTLCPGGRLFGVRQSSYRVFGGRGSTPRLFR